jgi:hypothetical protein
LGDESVRLQHGLKKIEKKRRRRREEKKFFEREEKEEKILKKKFSQAQMLHMSGQIALFRSQNVFGLQIWQLNEIWPTGKKQKR